MRSRRSGEYQAGELHSWASPRLHKVSSSRKGVIYSPSHEGTDLNAFNSLNRNISQALLKVGLPFITYRTGSDWGNSDSITRMENLYNYAPTHGINPRLLLGISGGAVPLLNWAKDNLNSFDAIVLILPGVDIQDVYDNNRGGYASSISVAHGGRPSDSLNPASNASLFANKNIKIWYSTNDNIINPATILDFSDESGASLRSLGDAGHTLSNFVGTYEVAKYLLGHS